MSPRRSLSARARWNRCGHTEVLLVHLHTSMADYE